MGRAAIPPEIFLEPGGVHASPAGGSDQRERCRHRLLSTLECGRSVQCCDLSNNKTEAEREHPNIKMRSRCRALEFHRLSCYKCKRHLLEFTLLLMLTAGLLCLDRGNNAAARASLKTPRPSWMEARLTGRFTELSDRACLLYKHA